MNFNALIALLELKGIITRAEGEALVEHLNNKPQSTLLADAIEQLKEFVKTDVPKLIEQAKPAIEKAAKAEAEKVAGEAVETAKEEAAKVAESVAADAKTAGDTIAHTGDVHAVPNTAKPKVKKVTDTAVKK